MLDCGPDHLVQNFVFANFATAATNWFLPWIALVAQLPYESTSHWTDLSCAFISLGSPALLCYSLVLTLMSQQYIRKEGKEILHRIDTAFGRAHKQPMRARFLSAVFILLETHQAALRARIDHGRLSDLVILDENDGWWKTAAESLERTRRGVTASLVAQRQYSCYCLDVAQHPSCSRTGRIGLHIHVGRQPIKDYDLTAVQSDHFLHHRAWR